MVNDHAYAAANEFAEHMNGTSTDQLVHLFHDRLIAVAVIPNLDLLHPDKDIASAIVDGIHFEFYGDASPSVIESLLQLWAERPQCFLSTFVDALGKENVGNRFVSMAAFCISPEQPLGATDAVRLIAPFIRISKEKAVSVHTCMDIMLKKK